jgi:hypothetical protein
VCVCVAGAVASRQIAEVNRNKRSTIIVPQG